MEGGDVRDARGDGVTLLDDTVRFNGVLDPLGLRAIACVSASRFISVSCVAAVVPMLTW